MSYSDKDGDGKIDVLRNNADVDGDGDNRHEIMQVKDYYPFGMELQRSENHPESLITGRKHNYGFNGVEEDGELGFDWLSMDLRKYDPTIARWTGVDPVQHYEYSPYQAFDNNPVFLVDPVGANSETLINDLWNASGSGTTTWTNQGNGTFSDGNGNSVTDEDTANSSGESPNDWYLDLAQGKVVWQEGSGDQYGKIWLGGGATSTQSLLNRLRLLGFDACFCKKPGDIAKAIYADTQAAYEQFARDHNKDALWQTLLLFNDMNLIFGGNLAGSFGNNLPTYKRFNYTPRYGNHEVVYGYYGIGPDGVAYVGITNNPTARFSVHGRATDGKAFLQYDIKARFNSRLDARIWEQQQINNFGKNNLLNRRNEIRPSLWKQYGIKN